MPSDPTADRADFQALQAGDEPALNRIVERWEQPLFAFAWRYVRNATDARELAIETFVRLHQQRQRLRVDTKLSAWLFTTLANLCHNHHRWQRRHATVSLDAPHADSPGGVETAASAAAPGEPTPADSLERKEALAAIDAGLAELPHALKTTLLLHHFDAMSYREIAAITGCSERGVETRLYRARQALRLAIERLTREAAAK